MPRGTHGLVVETTPQRRKEVRDRDGCPDPLFDDNDDFLLDDLSNVAVSGMFLTII